MASSLPLAALSLVAVVSCWIGLAHAGGVETLVGHGKPLGGHRPPDVEIDEFSEPISAETFFTGYVSQLRPVVFRGFAKQWPAFEKWTDARMSEEYGSLEIKVEPKKDGSSTGAMGKYGTGRDTIENFLAGYRQRDKYIVSELPSPMYKDVLVHPSLGCGELARSLVEVDLWMSSGGTRSRLHRDAYNAINCVLAGSKEWIMIDNNQTDNVYFVASGRYEMGGLSPIDVDSVDMKEHGRFKDVRYGFVNMEAGDCLFIPGGHYHQVKSTGSRNVAVSVLFGRVDKFSADECRDAPLEAKSLDQFDVMWRWNGTGIMDMGRGDDYFFKTLFKNRMTERDPAVSMKGLRRLLVEDMYVEMNDQGKQQTKEIMAMMDADKDGSISPADLDAVDRHVYRSLSFVLEGASDLQNTYDFEYGFVGYNVLRDAMEDMLGDIPKGQAVDKATFLETYVSEPITGSPHFGERLFKKFDSDGDGAIRASDLKADSFEENLREYEISYDDAGGRMDEEDEDGPEGEGGEEEGEMDEEAGGREEEPQPGEGDDVDFDFDQDASTTAGDEDEDAGPSSSTRDEL